MLESFKQVVNRNRWLFDFKFVNESKMTHHTNIIDIIFAV